MDAFTGCFRSLILNVAALNNSLQSNERRKNFFARIHSQHHNSSTSLTRDRREFRADPPTVCILNRVNFNYNRKSDFIIYDRIMFFVAPEISRNKIIFSDDK